MIITANKALKDIRSGRATICGTTRNEYDQDCVALTNHEHHRTDHVEISGVNITPAQRELVELSEKAGYRYDNPSTT